jgi:hypothetical protein
MSAELTSSDIIAARLDPQVATLNYAIAKVHAKGDIEQARRCNLDADYARDHGDTDLARRYRQHAQRHLNGALKSTQTARLWRRTVNG